MAYNDTALHVWDPFPDPSEVGLKPILTTRQKRELAKSAIEHLPGAREIFNKVFAGSVPANPLGKQPIVYTPGVPAFLWTQR